jgi:hypothetical protein
LELPGFKGFFVEMARTGKIRMFCTKTWTEDGVIKWLLYRQNRRVWTIFELWVEVAYPQIRCDSLGASSVLDGKKRRPCRPFAGRVQISYRPHAMPKQRRDAKMASRVNGWP